MRMTMLMPNLPPIVCGVADHGVKLGGALEKLGVSINYLGLRGGKIPSSASGMGIWDGSTNDLERALRRLSSDILWVQYSGYGYSKKGIPTRLMRAIEGVRKILPELTIVVCMHETHADKDGLGWRTPIVQPMQILTGSRIARTAHLLFATVEKNLARCVHDYGISPELASLLPIGSNIPGVEVSSGERMEFRKQLKLPETARIAVIFGTWATQKRTLRLFRDNLSLSLRNGQFDHVLAIGGDAADCQKRALLELGKELGKQFTVYGPAPALEIGTVLGCCDVGLVPTPLDFLRKSGVVAAFSASKLELWQKNARTGIVILRDIEPFPTWDQIAHMAMRQLMAHTSERELFTH